MLWKVPTVFGRIMVVGALTCVLCQIMWDLKAVQRDMQYRLIKDFMLYMFKLDCNTMEAIKNLCCANGDGAVDHSTVTIWLKKFYLGWEKLTDQAKIV